MAKPWLSNGYNWWIPSSHPHRPWWAPAPSRACRGPWRRSPSRPWPMPRSAEPTRRRRCNRRPCRNHIFLGVNKWIPWFWVFFPIPMEHDYGWLRNITYYLMEHYYINVIYVASIIFIFLRSASWGGDTLIKDRGDLKSYSIWTYVRECTGYNCWVLEGYGIYGFLGMVWGNDVGVLIKWWFWVNKFGLKEETDRNFLKWWDHILGYCWRWKLCDTIQINFDHQKMEQNTHRIRGHPNYQKNKKFE